MCFPKSLVLHCTRVIRRSLFTLDPINVVFLIVSFLDVREHALLNLVCKASKQHTHCPQSWCDTVDLSFLKLDPDLFAPDSDIPNKALVYLAKMQCRPSRRLRCVFDMDSDNHFNHPLGHFWPQREKAFFAQRRSTELELKVPCLGLACGILNLAQDAPGGFIPLRSLSICTIGTPLLKMFCGENHNGLGQLTETLIQNDFYHQLEVLLLDIDLIGEQCDDPKDHYYRYFVELFQFLRRLRRLQLPCPSNIAGHLGAKDVGALLRLSQLERLSVPCRASGLEALGKLVGLKHLEIEFGDDSAWGDVEPSVEPSDQVNLEHLTHLTNLHTLVICHLDHAIPYGDDSDPKWLLPLRQMTQLRRLVLQLVPQFSGTILQSLTGLTDLRLSRIVPSETSEIFNNLGCMPGLTRLELDCNSSCELHHHLPKLGHLPRLQRLSLGQSLRSFNVPPEVLPELTHLDLSTNASLTKAAFACIAQLDKLKVLELDYSTRSRREGFIDVARSADAFKQLKTVIWPDADFDDDESSDSDGNGYNFFDFRDDLTGLDITLKTESDKLEEDEYDLV